MTYYTVQSEQVSEEELSSRLVTNHRGVQYDPLVERDTSYARDIAEARTRAMEVGAVRAERDRAVPADSPGYQNGRTETEQERTMRRLLDPRYANPDWVPDRDVVADMDAERRDIERVEREGVWRP
jgi:hypothetical protein